MSAKRTDEQLFRRIFIVVLFAMVATVMLGLFPVWLSAEATRAAQHSQILKGEIADTLAVSETLEVQRAAIVNNFRLNPSDLEELGLVRSDGEHSVIELNSSVALSASLLNAPESNIGSDSVAELAAGTNQVENTDSDLDIEAPSDVTSVQGINLGQMAGNALDTIAELTAGEAATLLLGDVGLVGTN
ncbi:MAG: hypothetical protein FWC86_00400 [Coriobacteriia bacterium]|nr:hypothetical protein [Coriobacteriia bacterium]